jgi:hypothetical protein
LFAEMLEGLPTDDSAQTQKPVSYKSSVWMCSLNGLRQYLQLDTLAIHTVIV